MKTVHTVQSFLDTFATTDCNAESSVPELAELIVIVIVIPSSLPPGSTAPPPTPTLVMSSLLYPPLPCVERAPSRVRGVRAGTRPRRAWPGQLAVGGGLQRPPGLLLCRPQVASSPAAGVAWTPPPYPPLPLGPCCSVKVWS